MNLDTTKLDLFFNDYEYYRVRCLDPATLRHIFRHHPNAEYVVSKYTAQPDFHEFLVRSDTITAGSLFTRIAFRGCLPPHYLDFLRWFKFNDKDASWVGKTLHEKEILLAQYIASLPEWPKNDIMASLYPK